MTSPKKEIFQVVIKGEGGGWNKRGRGGDGWVGLGVWMLWGGIVKKKKKKLFVLDFGDWVCFCWGFLFVFWKWVG